MRWLFTLMMAAVLTPARANLLLTVQMTTRTTGWAVGKEAGTLSVLGTSDGGRHWRAVSPPGLRQIAHDETDNFDVPFGSAFLDARHAWIAAGDGGTIHLWKTTDGGTHWRECTLPAPEADDKIFIQAVDSKQMILLALSRPAGGQMAKQFYSSDNGGETWHRRTSPAHQGWSYYPTGLTFRTPNEGWIAATYHSEPNTPFLHTVDGGRHWGNQPLALPSGNTYGNTLPPHFFGPRHRIGRVILLARHRNRSGLIYGTDDGGRRWRRIGTLPFSENDPNANDVDFLTQKLGWAAERTGRVFQTRDGGRHWRQDGSLPVTAPLETIRLTLQMRSSTVGFALAQSRSGTALRSLFLETKDGGRRWRRVFQSSLPERQTAR